MALEKQDLIEIKKIIVEVVGESIEKSETKMSDKIEFAIEKSELRMETKIEDSKKEIIKTVDAKIEKSKKEIIEVLHEEVSDLSEINQKQLGTLADHEHRIIKIEKRLVAGM